MYNTSHRLTPSYFLEQNTWLLLQSAPELTGTRGALGVWNGRVQLVMRIVRANILIGRSDRIEVKVMKILSYYMRIGSEVKSKIKT